MRANRNNQIQGIVQAIILLVLFGMSKTSAQGIRAGSVSVLAKGTFSSYKSEWPGERPKNFNYSTSLQVNYFAVENLSVAMGYLYSGYRGKREHISPADAVYVIGQVEDFHSAFVQIRNYWFFNNHIAFFVQAGYGYGKGRSDWTAPDQLGGPKSYAYQQHQVEMTPGLAIFAHPKFSVEVNLGSAQYLSRRQQNENSTTGVKLSRFDANLIPNLNIGFQYFLTKR